MSPSLLALALLLGGTPPAAPPPFAAAPVRTAEEPSEVEREAEAVAGLAAELSARGLDFSDIFRELCARSAAAPDPALSFKAQFGGLMLWTERGGRPKLLGREDWGLHFIYGGWISAFFGLEEARSTGYEKERRDSTSAGNAFDLGDLAVTYFGAHWADRALSDPRGFPAAWAAGLKSLRSLPALGLGKLPPGTLPTDAELAPVQAWVGSSLN